MALAALFSLIMAVGAGFSQQSQPTEAEKAYAYGVGLYRDGLYQMALARLNDYLLRWPDGAREPQALYLAGECAFQLADWNGCRDLMKLFLSRHPFDQLADESELRLGQAELQAGRPAEAIAAFSRLLVDYPKTTLLPDVVYWSGEAALAAFDTAAALDSYRRQVDSFPDNSYAPWAAYATGFLKENQRDTTQALAAYQVVWNRYPASEPAPQAYYRAGNLQFRMGRYNEARDLLNQALQSVVNSEVNRHAHFLLGEIAYFARDFDIAGEHYRTLLQADSSSDPAPQAMFALAWLEGERGNWALAAGKFERAAAVLKDPFLSAQAFVEAGLAYRKSGDSDRALRVWQKAAHDFPGTTEAFRALTEIGREQYLKGKFTDAAQSLAQVTTTGAGKIVLAPVFRLLSAALKESGDERGALDAALNGMKQKPDPTDEEELLFTAGSLSHKLGDEAEARRLLESLTDKYPTGSRAAEALFWLGEARYAAGDAEGAESAYRELLRRFPECPQAEEARYGRAWALYRGGDYNTAAQAFSEFAKKYPDSRYVADADLRTADCYFSLKNWSRAETAYRSFYDRHPDNTDRIRAHYQWAVALLKLDRYDAATDAFNVHITKFPASEQTDDAGYMTGWAQFRGGKFEEAIAAYRWFIQQYPTSPYQAQAAYGIADGLYNLKRFPEAADAYEEVIQKYPDSPLVGDAISGLQWCAIQLGQADRALGVAERFAQQHPSSPLCDDLIMRVADLLYNANDYAKSADEYRQLVEKYPSSELAPAALYWQGRAKLALGDTTGALAIWKELSGKPNGGEPEAQALLETGRLLTGSGDLAGAVSALETIRERHSSSGVLREAVILEAGAIRLQGNAARALEMLKPYANQQPADLLSDRALLESARALGDLDRLDEALGAAARVANNRSDELGAEAQFEVGAVLRRQGKLDEAVDGFLKVNYIYPTATDWAARGMIAAAEIRIQQGKPADARELLERVKRNHGEDAWARQAAEMLTKLQ